VGIFLGQFPPAELARLKAELAETLIANFCYPRFFDYRTNSLHTRPVDRAKRQEVWLYLNSVDFSSWGRIDVMSPDFQRQIERLFIHFVQRNRNFFGEQGRKRMTDVRMLINNSSSSIVEGLRGHLTGRQTRNIPFGSPRPVTSWATTKISGRPELGWDQIVTATMLLQQQLQEERGEIKAAASKDVRTNGISTRRPVRSRSTENGSSTAEPEVLPGQLPFTNGPAPLGEEVRTTFPAQGQKAQKPFAPAATRASATVAAPASAASTSTRKEESAVISEDKKIPAAPVRGRSGESVASQVRPSEQERPSSKPTKVQSRDLPLTTQAPLMEVQSKEPESTTVLVGEEDVVIFEQMRHQLIVWLRVEAVRAGIDITGYAPAQLLEALGRQDDSDETRLQVISTLLNISNQIITNGHASLFEYKQAMMFYLMHTRRSN
jgi:hypothetical protein